MDSDTARQLLQDFELILGIAQQGIATIREFTEGPDFAPEAPPILTVEDMTNSPPTPLLAPPDDLNEQLPEDPGEQLLADHDEQFPDHWAPPTPPSPPDKKQARRTHDKTSSRSMASKPTRGQREATPSTRTDAATEADPEAPQPWTEGEIDLLRSLKTNTKAKHAWSVIATRLSRTVEDCKTQWALHK